MTKRSHCQHCQATRTVNRYDNGTVYSIRIQHQPECTRPRASRTSGAPTYDPHVLGPGDADDQR